MRGSLLITYTNDDGLGGDYLQVTSNGRILKRVYSDITKLYSIPIYLGDVITIDYVDVPPTSTLDLTLLRKDFTTDDEEGDKGIKESTVYEDSSATSVTFTATTRNDSYDFQYLLNNDVITNFQLWTEASEPILTESGAYLNQQF
jgi:hypothetical protein